VGFTSGTVVAIRYAYNLVLHHHGDMLYQGVKGEVRLHLSTVADLVGTNPDETLLRALDEKWRSHKVTMVMIRDILMYMVRDVLCTAAPAHLHRGDHVCVCCCTGPDICGEEEEGQSV